MNVSLFQDYPSPGQFTGSTVTPDPPALYFTLLYQTLMLILSFFLFPVWWYTVAIKEEEVKWSDGILLPSKKKKWSGGFLFFCKFFAFKYAQLNAGWIMSVVVLIFI